VERWAANTLRTLGIILTSGFVVVTALILVMLSMCAAKGGFSGIPHSNEAAMYMLGAALVVIFGVSFITWLARGIYRSTKIASDASAPESSSAAPESAIPLRLSPLGQQAINRLVFALGAQIALSVAVLVFNQLRFWSGPRIFAPFPSRYWMLALLIPFVLYHVPYAILIYALLKRPDRRAFAYSLAVPAVLIMQALLSLSYIGLFARQQPIALVLLFIPWAIHIVILVFAYQAIQQVGLHPQPSSLMVAAAVTLVFFLLVHTTTPILYRFLR